MSDLNGKLWGEGLTFDDVLLIPQYSQVLPQNVSLKTRLSPEIELNIPLLSAAMDTVTEAELAIALAQLGGMGFIHKNLSIAEQTTQIKQVKNHPPTATHLSACCDPQGRLRVGAAVGVSENLERVNALVQAGVDMIAVDSAHGHSEGVLETIRRIRHAWPNVSVLGGNIVTAEAALALIQAGAHAVKVGVGPGSICTTRVVAGVGVPQVTAINTVYALCKAYQIPVVADGGIQLSGDIVKALAAGADAVMLGSLFAGTQEAPGEDLEINGKPFKRYVGMGSIAAMKRGSSDRYFQSGQEAQKLVPEGIQGCVPYKGPLTDIVYQLCGGLRSGMGYCGTATIEALKTQGKFVRITPAGLKESHPHHIAITHDAPNYGPGHIERL